jgi:GT2 family glycosyltransferase
MSQDSKTEFLSGAADRTVSIVIPCCGMLEYTRVLLTSLLKNTRPPYELIFVDIGSLDGTMDFLAGFSLVCRSLGVVRVEVVRATSSLDIQEAARASLRAARGQFVVLLNNDTIVPENWLQQLVGLATTSPAVGLIGPMSNCAKPPQLVQAVPYCITPNAFNDNPAAESGLTAFRAFAREFHATNRGKWTETDRLGGFCVMIKRSIIDQLTAVHDFAEKNCFDSELLCDVARMAKLKIAVCCDLFVHHFGTQQFSHGAPENSV